MIIAKVLSLQQFIEVGFHQILYNVPGNKVKEARPTFSLWNTSLLNMCNVLENETHELTILLEPQVQ